MKHKFLFLAGLTFSLSTSAVPSFKQCSGVNGALHNILFDSQCTTAYVGLPDTGTVVLDSYSSLEIEGLCEGYDQLIAQNTSVKRQLNEMFRDKLSWIENQVSQKSAIDEKKVKFVDILNESELILVQLADTNREIQQQRTQLAELKSILEGCSSDHRCNELEQEYQNLQTAYFNKLKEKFGFQSDIRILERKADRLSKNIDILEKRISDTKERIEKIDAELIELDDFITAQLQKYLDIYGGTAKLIYSVNMDNYVEERKQLLGHDAEKFNWKPINMKDVRLSINISEAASSENYQSSLSPVINIVTPRFSVFNKETIWGNPDSTQNSILELGDVNSNSTNDYILNSKAFPTSFSSIINFNLHGACMLRDRPIDEISTLVNANLAAEYEVKGFASYHATVNQHSILEFLREIKSRGFLGFGSVKSKIRKTESHSQLVKIELNAESYQGQQITERYKRLLSTSVLERASIAILDSIATRVSGNNNWLPDLYGDEESADMTDQLIALGPRLNMTSMMCRSGGKMFCGGGWQVGKFSFSDNSYRYKSETKAHYEESISDVYFQTFSNSIAFENVPNQ